MVVRRLIHSLGYRYSLHRKDLPGKPDMVFTARKKVIFVHGCFWHSHNCKPSLVPRSNRDFWVTKLEKNRSRDKQTLELLQSDGWDALVIWQCELKDLSALTARIKVFLDDSSGLRA